MDNRTKDSGIPPGLRQRHRRDGSTAYYWVAMAVSKDAKDYPLKTVRLFGDEAMIDQRCRVLTIKLKEWLKAEGKTGQAFDGTLKALIKIYQRTAESPYHRLKHNSRVMYDESLDIIERDCGSRLIRKLTGLDFQRWYNEWKAPVEPGKPERMRRGYKAMQLLRIVVKFGVVANVAECERLSKVLENMRFQSPPARIEQMTYAQVQTFVTKAIEMGRLSMAIAQVLEFELTLRQVDVIGQWAPANGNEGGILDRGQRWSGGCAWSHIDADGLFTKQTTKRGQVAEHDTTAYPYLVSILDLVPAEKRIGPMVIDEGSGLPYRYRNYARVWRKIATAAGIPLNVWNRDSRAGGITEGSDSGADIEHLRHHATHADIATTGRYNRRTVEKTRTVAKLRVAHREEGK